ncbi:MAG: hypothetical protein K1Y02_18345 [Candidatus Hydrogenedentes bacterium]|nr:hypothetical protein [Candidatus Hydrogenedentota bacterium]
MMERATEMGLVALAGYAGLGVLAAIALHARGLHRIDSATRGAGLWFRALITPGIVALWPFLLAKWRHAHRGETFIAPVEYPVRPESLRRMHGLVIHVLAVALPIVVAAAILTRTSIVPMRQPVLDPTLTQAISLSADESQ